MPKPDFPEFIAATLPPAQQWKGRMVWRPDLSVHQVSDGSTWSTVGSSVPGAGNRGVKVVTYGDSHAAYNGVAVSTTSFTAVGGIVTVVTSGAHSLRDGQRVTISGTSNASLHVRNTPIQWISSTSFSYALPSAVGSATTGNVLAQNQPSPQGAFVQTNALMGGRFLFLANMGVGGQRSDEILARISEVIALKPDIVWLNMLTNDVLQDRDTALSWADADATVSQLNASGIFVVIETLLPFGGAANWTATRNAALQNHNRSIRELTARYRNVLVIDSYREVLDTTDAVKGYGLPRYYQTGDTVHKNSRATHKIAIKAAAALAPLFPATDKKPTGPTDNYGFDASNLNLFDAAPWSNTTSAANINSPAVTAAAWQATTIYAKDSVVITGGRVYTATAGGTSSGVAPTHTSGTAVDGTVTWQFLESGAVSGLPSGWIVDATGTWTVPPAVYVVPRKDQGYNIKVAGLASTNAATVTIRTNSTAQNARLPSFAGRLYRWVCELSVLNAVSGGLRAITASAQASVAGASGIIASAYQPPVNQAGLLAFDTDSEVVINPPTAGYVIPTGAFTNHSFNVVAVMDTTVAPSGVTVVGVGAVGMQPTDTQ